MNWTLFKKTLRDLRWPFLFVTLLLFLVQIIRAMITWRVTKEVLPQFEKYGIKFETLFQIITSGTGEFVRTLIAGDGLMLNNPAHLQTFGFVDPGVVILFCVWSIGRGAALAGELERGTMELLLAQPIARWQVIVTHLAVDLVTVPLMVVAMVAGVWVGVNLLGLEGITVQPYWRAALNAAGLVLCLIAATMALAVRSRSRWRAMSWIIALVLVMFLLSFLGQLLDWLRPWRVLSVFYYYQPQGIVIHGRVAAPIQLGYGPEAPTLHVHFVPFLYLLAALGYTSALVGFCRRDLPAPL
jgi:ABC-2 type transport system permease protein